MILTKQAQIIYENMERLEKVIEILETAYAELNDIDADTQQKSEDAKVLRGTSTDLWDVIDDLNDLLEVRLEEFKDYTEPSMEKEDVFDVIEERDW